MAIKYAHLQKKHSEEFIAIWFAIRDFADRDCEPEQPPSETGLELSREVSALPCLKEAVDNGPDAAKDSKPLLLFRCGTCSSSRPIQPDQDRASLWSS